MTELRLHENLAVVTPEAECELAALRLLALVAAIGWQQAAHQLGVLANTHIKGCDYLQDGVVTDWGAGLLCVLHLLRLSHLQSQYHIYLLYHDLTSVYCVIVL